MSKKVAKIIKLQIPAGKANPAPPIGPALGGAGVNIMAFCKEFNAKTQSLAGDILPVIITVYVDKSFTFICKKPPVAELLKKSLDCLKDLPYLTEIRWAELSAAKRAKLRKRSCKISIQLILKWPQTLF